MMSISGSALSLPILVALAACGMSESDRAMLTETHTAAEAAAASSAAAAALSKEAADNAALAAAAAVSANQSAAVPPGERPAARQSAPRRQSQSGQAPQPRQPGGQPAPGEAR